MRQLFAYTPPTPRQGLVGFVQLFEGGHPDAFRIVVRNHRGDGQHAECPLPRDQAVALARAILTATTTEMEPT